MAISPDSTESAPAAEAPKSRTRAAPVDDGLVAITDGETVLRIHPSAVAEHEELGWAIAG